MVRGTPAGLEFVFADGNFSEAAAEVRERLAERPDFYRGSRATAIFDGIAPPAEAFAAFVTDVRERGVALDGLYGGAALQAAAEAAGLPYLGEPQRPAVASFERKRAAKAGRADALTDAARSLDADFAGARADIARRRARGEASVPKPVFAPPGGVVAATVTRARPSTGPQTLYHRGTLRGGKTLRQLGNIVVLGDVNPGAELIASGDILVFGALRGIAHAGAQGDATARVAALELAPTQLRIGAYIAADDPKARSKAPEVAFVQGERIAIAPYDKIGERR